MTDSPIERETGSVRVRMGLNMLNDQERVIDTLIEANKLGDRADPKVRDMMRNNAAKRVLIEIKPEKVVSWDHSKLGGVY